MDFQQLLPIGTVVLLRGTEKKLMIFGIGQLEPDTGITYDYAGVFYPEGNVGDGSAFLFNHSDIEEVCFRGFENDERRMFIAQLEQALERSFPEG